MIKKILNDLYNMSLDHIEEMSLTLWSNIREVLFVGSQTDSSKDDKTKKVGGYENE